MVQVMGVSSATLAVALLAGWSSGDTAVDQLVAMRTCYFISCSLADRLMLLRRWSSKFSCSAATFAIDEDVAKWYTPGHGQFILLNGACSGVEKFLHQAEQLQLFNRRITWFISCSEDMTHTCNDLTFANIQLTFASQVYVHTTWRGVPTMTRVYKRDPSSALVVHNLSHLPLNSIQPKVPTLSPLDMEGHTLSAGVAILDPASANHMYDNVDVQVDNISKVNIAFFKMITDSINASGRIQFADAWGSLINGSFNGVVGVAQRGEADLIATPVLMHMERMDTLDYFAITSHIRIRFIFLSPPFSLKNNIYTLPFSSQVWYCGTIIFLLSVLGLHITTKHEENDVDAGSLRLRPSWSDTLLTKLAVFCQNDCGLEPNGTAGRLLSLSVRMAVLFLSVSYTAAVVVLLQSSDKSITTLEDLEQSDMAVGAEDTPYNRMYLDTECCSDQVRKRLSKVMSFLPLHEGMSKLRKGRYAYFMETSAAYYAVRTLLTEREKCQLQELKESFIKMTEAYVSVRKNSSYTKMYKMMYRRLHEHGLVHRQVTRMVATKPPCMDTSRTWFCVGLVDCYQGFTFLASGAITAILVFVCELWFHHRHTLQHDAK